MMEREELLKKLGEIIYKIGQKQEIIRKKNKEIQSLQTEANNVASEIEELDGKRDNT
jgi:hypothetical protein